MYKDPQDKLNKTSLHLNYSNPLSIHYSLQTQLRKSIFLTHTRYTKQLVEKLHSFASQHHMPYNYLIPKHCTGLSCSPDMT